MHGKENQVVANEGPYKMNVAQHIVHVPAEQFRIPKRNPGKYPEYAAAK